MKNEAAHHDVTWIVNRLAPAITVTHPIRNITDLNGHRQNRIGTALRMSCHRSRPSEFPARAFDQAAVLFNFAHEVEHPPRCQSHRDHELVGQSSNL